MIDKDRFHKISDGLSKNNHEASREISVTTRLLIRKSAFDGGRTKWTFEWNGQPILAKVESKDSLDLLMRRGILIGNGDALDVEMTYLQIYDAKIDYWKNDAKSYVVKEVYQHVSASADNR